MTKCLNSLFIGALARNLPAGEAAWVTGFSCDPFSSGAYWGGRPVLGKLPFNIQPHHNNYVCVSTFAPDPDGTWRRRKANFSAMRAVMVDDVGTKVPLERISLPPSVLVETSPGNFQAWYFLEPPEQDPVRADLLVKRMIAAGLTADAKDPGMRGVTRYGRLPTGRNSKAVYVERLGHPFVQRVAVWQPDRRYAVEALAKAFNLSLHPEPVRHLPTVTAGRRADDLLQSLNMLELYSGPMDSMPGGHRIICPWAYEHTGMDETGTVYFEPSEVNSWRGGFVCHHGHCANRSIKDLQRFLQAVKRKHNKKGQ